MNKKEFQEIERSEIWAINVSMVIIFIYVLLGSIYITYTHFYPIRYLRFADVFTGAVMREVFSIAIGGIIISMFLGFFFVRGVKFGGPFNTKKEIEYIKYKLKVTK